MEPSEIRLVAAHGWDVAGALAAGCRAAFVGREGKALNPHGKQADIIGTGMHDVVSHIIERDLRATTRCVRIHASLHTDLTHSSHPHVVTS